MKVLHLGRDHNFISDSKKRFEEFYPGQNIFVAHNPLGEFKMLKDTTGFLIYDLTREEQQAQLIELCRREKVNKVVIHGMVSYMAKFLPKLKAACDVKIYWLFWGYELYETLAYKKGYPLLDDKFELFNVSSYYKPYFATKLVRKLLGVCRADDYEVIMPMVDYFCFWDIKDYELLQKYYNLPLKFRFFAYGASYKGQEVPDLFELKERPARNILINHQASAYGNHAAMFRLLADIDKENTFHKIVPISYGHKQIKQDILKKGEKYFGDKFRPIEKYMPKAEYFELLEGIDIAIFGQRRQEASGNIIQLLRNGVKVFLRNDNNLLEYYRKKGYIIFSVEDDLKDMSALTSLTLEQKRHNRETALSKRLYYEDFMPGVLND